MPADRRLTQARLGLHRLAIGGWAAQALFAGNELGVFEALAAGPATAAEVAMATGTDEDATARLLGALAAAGVLEREEDRFRNGIAADAYLVPDKEGSMTEWVALIGRWNQVFGDLPASVRTGEPAEAPDDHLGHSPEYTRRFILGMHDYAIGPGRELANHLDLSGRRRLLDLGGGPGTYSVLLAEHNPRLECVVYDLPEVTEIAAEVIADHDLSERVRTAAGDYHSDAPPAEFDTVLISNVLHQESRDSCLAILRKAWDALESGGLLVVQAMFLNEDGDGPLWPAVHNLLMLLIYAGGRAYSAGETLEMVKAAGFIDPEGPHGMSPFNAESFVTAHKP